MEIDFSQAALLAAWSFVVGADALIEAFYLHRPLVSGLVVGWILGDWQTGLVVGATLELAALGLAQSGGAQSANVAFSGVVGAAFAVLLRIGPEAAAALAAPLAFLAQSGVVLLFTLFSPLMHTADRWAEAGNIAGIRRMQWAGLALHGAVFSLTALVMLRFGAEPAADFLAAAPVWIVGGLIAAGGLLPAVGLAMLLRRLMTKRRVFFFIGGFVFAAYLHLPLAALAAFGVCAAACVWFYMDAGAGRTAAGRRARGESQSLFSRRDWAGMIWRSLFLQASFNYERMQAGGWLYAVLPALRRVYPERGALGRAMRLHMEFFYTHPLMVTFIIGVVAAMEERRMSGEAIRGARTALMGSLSHIGDAFWRLVLLPLTGALGASAALGLEPDPWGPLLFLAMLNGAQLCLRCGFLRCGYAAGARIFTALQHHMRQTVEALAAFGLIVGGGLLVSLVQLRTTWVVIVGPAHIALQEQLLDAVAPHLLPLLYTLLLCELLRRNVAPARLTFLTVALGLAGRGFGIW